MNVTKTHGGKQRSVGLVDRAGTWYLVQITTNSQMHYYLVTQERADFGTAFLVEKQDNEGTCETYHVNAGDEETWPTCDCTGFCYRQKCKHVDAIRALQKSGKLPGYSSLPNSSIRETGRRFQPGRDDEPRRLPLSERYRSLSKAMECEPEAFRCEPDEWADYPDDAA